MLHLRTLSAVLVAVTAATIMPARGDVYVSGNHNSVIRFDDDGNFIEQFTNGGEISLGRGVVFGPDGNLYVCSVSTNAIVRYDGQTGDFIDDFASGGGVSAPWDLVFGPEGDLYVSQFQGNVNQIDGDTGEVIRVFAHGASASGLHFGPDGLLYVSSFNQDRIKRYDPLTGDFIDNFVSAGASGLDGPESLRFGPDGHLYVASRYANSVLRFDGTTGDFIDVFASGNGLDGAIDIDFGPDGHLYVASFSSVPTGVYRFDGQSGAFIDVFASGGGISAASHFAFFAPAQTCAADIDGDGMVEVTDLLTLLSNWGPYAPCPPYAPADANQDCTVGVTDLLALLAAWGDCSP